MTCSPSTSGRTEPSARPAASSSSIAAMMPAFVSANSDESDPTAVRSAAPIPRLVAAYRTNRPIQSRSASTAGRSPSSSAGAASHRALTSWR
jgi:hypothetical protein